MMRGKADRGRWGYGIAVVWMMSALLAGAGPASDAADQPASEAEEGAVRVGSLTYADGRHGVCFADDFLDTVARESDVAVVRHFDEVALAGEALFDYPFVVMTGEGAFSLSDAEKQNLKAYLDGGGFLLASAGCSNPEWADSFRAVMQALYGDEAMAAVGLEHPLFHTIYDIDRIDVRKSQADSAALFGLTRHDHLRVVFSPLGLNDTGNAGQGCCCCGGSEIRNARLINANILAYAMTH